MRSFRRVARALKLVAVGLLVAAVAQELAQPEDRRTWHGRVAGVVPYDFRLPTWSRIREAYWNPTDPRLLTERVLGVGWSVNFYQVRRLAAHAFRRISEGRTRPIELRRGAFRRRP
jgi:hypothetical protein